MSTDYGQFLQVASTRIEAAQVPSWKVPYEKIVGESGAEKLLILIHATEFALFLRWQELGYGPADKSERASMNAAAADLLTIKLHKLSWSV